jgi:hypothetical protein
MKHRKRNYGYGRNLKYAAKRALINHVGERYSTVSSHSNRFNLFAEYCKKEMTNNAIYITQDLFEGYAYQIQEKVMLGQVRTSYAHNLISTVNVVMNAFRKDNKIWISPLSFFGPRSHIRKVAPNLSFIAVRYACKKIRRVSGDDIAMIIWIARILGTRLKEAVLIDAKKALKQAITTGYVDIRKGTKGGRGRKVKRLVPSDKRIIKALKLAVNIQGTRSSFIPQNEKLITFYRRVHRVSLPILKEFDLTNIRDLRAAYACNKHEMYTGVKAPVLTGDKLVKTDETQSGRTKISHELGHNREYVINSYCGG